MRIISKYTTASLLLILTIFSTACGHKAANEPINNPKAPEVTQPKEDITTKVPSDNQEATTNKKIKVYFSDRQALRLKSELRELKDDTKEDAIRSVIQALIEGPKNQKLASTLPKGTKLLSVKVKNNIAYLDFSKEIMVNHTGGSAGETMTIYSMVNSLCQINGIKSVQFLINGHIIDSIWGNMETVEPITPDSGIIDSKE
jgi:germination protein M